MDIQDSPGCVDDYIAVYPLWDSDWSVEANVDGYGAIRYCGRAGSPYRDDYDDEYEADAIHTVLNAAAVLIVLKTSGFENREGFTMSYNWGTNDFHCFFFYLLTN